MSLFGLMQSAAAQAQGIAASLQGAQDGYNTLYNGAQLLGVYGPAQVTDIANDFGGYSRHVLLTVTFTRDQFAEAPQPKTVKLIRTDMGAPISYTVNVVNINDPLIYQLVVEHVGPKA